MSSAAISPNRQPVYAGSEDHGPVARINGIGEVADVVGGEEPHLRAFDAWQGYVATGGADNKLPLNGVGEDAAQ